MSDRPQRIPTRVVDGVDLLRYSLPAAERSRVPCDLFVIRHDSQRYGNTKGSEMFGNRIVVSGVTADQAEAIADAMSFCFDAGLTDQYVVETTENTPVLAIAEYNRLTQEEFRARLRSSEFSAAVDATIPSGPIADGSAMVMTGPPQYEGLPRLLTAHDPATCWHCLNEKKSA